MTCGAVIGIDIGKTSVHLVALDAPGAIQWKKKFSRSQLMRHVGEMPRCLIGMEACCGAHHLARELAALGYDVRLMAPQFVKPFVKSNKRSEEHTSELQSLMRISYAVFCLKKKKTKKN